MLKITTITLFLAVLIGSSIGHVSASTAMIDAPQNTPTSTSQHVVLVQQIDALISTIPSELQDAWKKVIGAFDELKKITPLIESGAVVILDIASAIAAIDGKPDIVADINKAKDIITGVGSVIEADNIATAVTQGENVITTIDPNATNTINQVNTVLTPIIHTVGSVSNTATTK